MNNLVFTIGIFIAALSLVDSKPTNDDVLPANSPVEDPVLGPLSMLFLPGDSPVSTVKPLQGAQDDSDDDPIYDPSRRFSGDNSFPQRNRIDEISDAISQASDHYDYLLNLMEREESDLREKGGLNDQEPNNLEESSDQERRESVEGKFDGQGNGQDQEEDGGNLRADYMDEPSLTDDQRNLFDDLVFDIKRRKRDA